MTRFLRRILSTLLVLFAVVSATFFVSQVLPSDPARLVAGPQARPKDVERIRLQLGLDRPVLVQYTSYLRRLVHVSTESGASLDLAAAPPSEAHKNCGTLGPVHFDLGRSYQMRRPVAVLIAERFPRSIALAIAALFVQLLVGLGLALWGTLTPNGRVDRALYRGSAVGLSVPTFVLGIVLQYIFAYRLAWLPIDGFGETFLARAHAIVLPALTLGIYGGIGFYRMARSELQNALGEDYARSARAKGAARTRVVLVHALRNAAIPLVTVIALDLGTLIGGAVVTESLFRWPGVAALSVSALLDRDGPLLLGTVLVTSIAIVLSNLFADSLYSIVDPRMRGKERAVTGR